MCEVNRFYEVLKFQLSFGVIGGLVMVVKCVFLYLLVNDLLERSKGEFYHSLIKYHLNPNELTDRIWLVKKYIFFLQKN